MSLLRQPFDSQVKSILDARKAEHQRMLNGGTDTTGNYSRRLPAWAKITIPGTNAPAIVMNREGFQGRYDQSHGRPKEASLKSITIRRVTGYAPRVNLTLEVEVEFEVYTFEDFERYARAYLRRHPERKPLKIEWGNGATYGGRGATNHELNGAMVLAGGFTNSELNTYQCKFTAIGPANAICELDIFGMRDLKGIFKGQKFRFQRVGQDGFTEVSNIIEKIMHDLQYTKNNELLVTQDKKNGEEPELFTDGSREGIETPDKVGKIFSPFKGSKAPNLLGRVFNQTGEQSGIESDAHEYLSLEYIVWLINSTVLRTVVDKCGQQLDYRIVFEDNDRHYSRITKDLGHFRSANPIEVLFLDFTGACGKYCVDGDCEAGKDFNITPGGVSDFAECVDLGQAKLNHKKILIDRRSVISPLLDVIEKRQKESDDKKKNSLRMDRESDNILKVNTFFSVLFDKINRASGGYVNLSLKNYEPSKVKDPREAQKLIITDTNTIWDDAPLNMLDPVKGDGSTFRVSLDGKLPDNLLALSLIPGLEEGSGTSGKYSQDDTALNELFIRLIELKAKLTSDQVNDGCYAKMASKNFDPTTVQDTVSTLAEYRKVSMALKLLQGSPFEKFDFVEYFDISMNIEMEGVFPIIAGNIFSSKNLPSFARPDNKVGFVALDIEDRIEAPGFWTTTVQARLTPYV